MARLEDFFRDHMDALPPDADTEVVQTLSVRRVMQRAVWQKESSGKDHVEVGDSWIAAIFEEEDSFSRALPHFPGVHAPGRAEYISHGCAIPTAWRPSGTRASALGMTPLSVLPGIRTDRNAKAPLRSSPAI